MHGSSVAEFKAIAIIHDLGVQVVTGHRFLSGFIGSLPNHEQEEYMLCKGLQVGGACL